MMLWLVLGAMTLLVVAGLLVPLLVRVRQPATRQAHDVAVYRDQLAEVEADAARGIVTAAEAEAAKREIQRRILRTADEPEREAGDAGWRVAAAGTLAVAVPVAAALIYASLGRPWEPDHPRAARLAQAGQAAPAPAGDAPQQDIASMAEKLRQRLAQNPDDARGWSLLGRTYWELGRFADAADAYRRAIDQGQGDDAGLQMAYGEALVYAAEGLVTPVARQVFNELRTAAPGHAGARYYLGLARLQDDDAQGAYQAWLALARDTPAGAPWIDPLRRRLLQVGAALGIDVEAELPETFTVAAAPPPTPPMAGGGADPGMPQPSAEAMQAAKEMSAEDRQAFIRSMVQRLADRLEESPDDPQGWMRLGRAYGVLGEHAKAAEAYGKAAALQPDNGEALYQAGVGAAKAGDVEQAIRHWEKLLAGMDPASPDYQRLSDELSRVKAMR
jgi:cytochrome c-type biogenesis protein CcmH